MEKTWNIYSVTIDCGESESFFTVAADNEAGAIAEVKAIAKDQWKDDWEIEKVFEEFSNVTIPNFIPFVLFNPK
jgi:hypothetical protein